VSVPLLHRQHPILHLCSDHNTQASNNSTIESPHTINLLTDTCCTIRHTTVWRSDNAHLHKQRQLLHGFD
jgi:hypothetical protein